MKNLLIIEDLPEVARWLVNIVLRIFPEADVRVTITLVETKKIMETFIPDLVLIDLGLPDGDGSTMIPYIKSKNPEVYCVVTTIFDDASHLFPALRAGADGYLLKDDEDQQFAAALEGIISGRPPLSASIAQMMLKQFRPVTDIEVSLTCREEDILVLIANGYSVKRAAESLGISAHTASGYLKSLYQKLQVTNRAEAALKAVNMGLINPNDKA
ncbi:MAG: response regulator transcription factor [Oleibacter sp.]|nr:response regulator transcription factor [Thalassolituus sp.]